jgi:hypothetical protein
MLYENKELYLLFYNERNLYCNMRITLVFNDIILQFIVWQAFKCAIKVTQYLPEAKEGDFHEVTARPKTRGRSDDIFRYY